MASADSPDPYIDPATGVLKNLVGASTRIALNHAEGDLSFVRMLQLLDHPPVRTNDLDELRSIHRHLFQDVYDWAGELRTVDLRKSAGRREPFLPVPMIRHAAAVAAGELQEENGLRGLDRDRFIERLAYHYDQVNYIHPFREGNGRVQRLFWSRVARDAGWQLDWRRVHGSVNDTACQLACEEQDRSLLIAMFGDVVVGPVVDDRDPDRLAFRLHPDEN